LRRQAAVRRFLLKRLSSLALPCPQTTPDSTLADPPTSSRRSDEIPLGADIAAGAQIVGVMVEKPLPCHTPSSLKHGKRIVGQKLGQARDPIVILVVKCISEPSKLDAVGF